MGDFRQYIEEESPTRRLSVFDFDGTIANVPERPKAHEPKHGWSGKDWWGSKHSLSEPFYTGSVNQEVVDAFKEARNDPNTVAIMLTGRRGIASPYVRNVLRNQELYGRGVIGSTNEKSQSKFQSAVDSKEDMIHPDENSPNAHQEFYSGDFMTEKGYPTKTSKKGKEKPDSNTLAHKTYVINKLVDNYKGFDIIEIWDDRKDHIEAFRNVARILLKEGKTKQFIIHQVYPPPYPGGQANVVHMPVTLESVWRNKR